MQAGSQSGEFTADELAGLIRDACSRLDEMESATRKALAGIEELVCSEKKFRTLAEFATDWVYWISPDLGLAYISPSCEKITGYRREEFLENPSLIEQIIHPDDKSKSCRRLHSVTPDGPHDVEIRILTRDSQTKFVEHSCHAVFDEDGKFLGRRSSNRDITGRKLGEDQLRKSRELFKMLVDYMPYAILVSRGEKQDFVYFNPTFCELFGYTIEDVHNVSEWWPLVYPEVEYRNWVSEEWTRRIQAAIASKEGIEPLEAVVRCKDGSDKIIEWGLVSSGDYNIVIAADLTQRRVAEREKQKLQDQLFQTRKLASLGTLVGGLAHDFNNMLQIIIGYSEMLGESPRMDANDMNKIETIISTSHEGADLVKKLLAFGQQAQSLPQLMDLNDQIPALIASISRTIPDDIQIRVNLTHQPTAIKLAQNQLETVFSNLAQNALEAMQDGGILTVSTGKAIIEKDDSEEHSGMEPGSYVILKISDTGRGIEKENLSRIFDPFYSTKTRGSTRGTGLGLSVVMGIVYQNGGYIRCLSEPGKGTEFIMYLPSVELAPEISQNASADALSKKLETIMLVEDVSFIAKWEKTFLESEGYDVILAKNGQEAVEIYNARKNEISLVCLDLIMPLMSGQECLKELLEINPSVKVLVISGYTQEDELKKQICPYVKGFVSKPCNRVDLLEQVRSALDS